MMIFVKISIEIKRIYTSALRSVIVLIRTFGKSIASSVILLCTLTNCSVEPEPLSDTAHFAQVQANFIATLENQEPVTRPITLAEAIARALKYNLTHRIQQAQTKLEAGRLKLAYLELLPDVNASVSLTHRNSESKTGQLVNGAVNFNQVSPQPKDNITGSLGLEYNLLDLGLSYNMAQQQANRLLASEESIRKIIHQLIEEVVEAYWKALAAQEISQQLDRLKQRIVAAIERSEQISVMQAGNVTELNYQSALIRGMRKANGVQREVNSAISQLMRLMNIRPDECPKLIAPSLNLPEVNAPLAELDRIALLSRPELRGANYLIKIQEIGIENAVLGALPSLKFNFGYNYDNNKYLLNHSWLSEGISSSVNLMKSIISGPQNVDVAKQDYELAKLKQAADALAVLTQVRIALLNYGQLKDDYLFAVKEETVAAKLLEKAANDEENDQGTEQLIAKSDLEYLSLRFDKGLSLAKAHSSLLKIYGSLGIDIIDDKLRTLPLAELTKAIEVIMQQKITKNLNYQDLLDSNLPNTQETCMLAGPML